MATSPLIVSATADDVAYFAARRYADEHGRTLYRDLAAAAPSGVHVAKDEGTPIAIGFAHALEDEWYLSELYVEPSFRSHGIASELLRAMVGEAGDASRGALLDASDLDAAAFFLRRGVALAAPVLEVAGTIPHENELARMAAGAYRFRTEPLDPMAHRVALAQLDRDVRGTARPLDHQYFATSATGVIFARDEEITGYAYVWPSGRIGPMVSASPAYNVQFLGFALAASRQTYGATWCVLLVPGTNLRVLRASTATGLRVQHAHIFANDASMGDLSRCVGLHALLF